jgi:radical SAM-linked protein
MIGLPNETFEDLDEIVILLKKIKDKTKELSNQKGFYSKPFELTCTISTFVPKSFTPFQWYGQNSVELIERKISYLKEKSGFLKGVKLNFNDSFLCRIEAVFARGDRSLNSLIEKVYQKGSYLDAWNESFNKRLWEEASVASGIDLEFYASREINPEKELPWDFIDTGLDKDWLIDEYHKSLQAAASIPCDEKCSNCGVCSSFKTSPKTVDPSPLIFPKKIVDVVLSEEESFRYRLKLQKTGVLKYISHLDWLRMIYRSLRKAGLKLCYTKGFNPSPKISIGNALPLFVESICEYADIEIAASFEADELKEKINEFLPEESKILQIVKISKDKKALDRQVSWAEYVSEPLDCHALEAINLRGAINEFLSKENVFFQKEKHKDLKQKHIKKVIDIKPCVRSVLLEDEDSGILRFILSAGQGFVEKENIGKNEPRMNKIVTSLRADKFLEFLYPSVKWKITRTGLLDSNLDNLI